jgi:hypothetical protein
MHRKQLNWPLTIVYSTTSPAKLTRNGKPHALTDLILLNSQLGLATTTHLANYINLTSCGFSQTQSELADDLDDCSYNDDDCWRFYYGLMEDRLSFCTGTICHLLGLYNTVVAELLDSS